MKFRQKGLILLILLNVKCPSSYFACKIRIKYFTASKRKKMASWKLNKVKKTNRCDHTAEVGIYKRKKESEQESDHARVTKKRTRSRKHALVQESIHEKKNSFKKTLTRPRKRPRKKELVQENKKKKDSSCFN